MNSKSHVIHWFRQDLRLSDNPALHEAATQGAVLPVYILDDAAAGDWAIGAASRVWLYHSLQALDASLKGKLQVYCGDALNILVKLVGDTQASAVYINRCYEPAQQQQDEKIAEALESMGVQLRSYNGSLLWEPWEITKSDGTPYRVFTPYYKKGCLKAQAPRTPLPAPKAVTWAKKRNDALDINSLDLLPKVAWDKPLIKHWKIGEKNAQTRLYDFIEAELKGYKEGRNHPSKPNYSRLSPHLHFGEISPNQAWYAIKQAQAAGDIDKDADHYLSELAWREFSYLQLYYFPALPDSNMKTAFDALPWRKDATALKHWQRGTTGYPIVDAGMRQLWQTGFMHNRIRMVVASFLIKNLMIDWRVGERWFWDCLVDADLANNAASWQWVAGSGADAAPYFRVFNPVLQAIKFDAEGDYIRRYVPELAKLPSEHLFAPWEAPKELLERYGIVFGKTYPHPIVNLYDSRDRALSAYKMLPK